MKIDMIGKRYGRLTVLKENGRCGSFVSYDCKCDCGTVLNVCGNSLRQGRTKSCGCLRSELTKKKFSGVKKTNLIGQKFGKLTVIAETNQQATDGSYYWLCLCECGNTCRRTSSKLKTTTSCGCEKEIARIKALKTDECKDLHRKLSSSMWPKAVGWLEIQDNTNLSYVKSLKPRKDSSTGIKGVYCKRGKYYASLQFRKQKYKAGPFSNIDDAASARKQLYDDVVTSYLKRRKE